ncbi:terminase [Blastococcus sp. TBT05-19]|uniref:terminase large subunit domain-containing protein n=1 Tax=Blastococcus sp. TBT05-19 TaxID=2250581 RepID=UPI000DEB8706|nr:terminase family protein [Blastococcus sp. TBT05-19]RBY94083.1 terminase [Blastococcus sp. TBT05-19]
MTALAGDLAQALDPVVFAKRLGFAAEPWQSRLLRSRARRQLVASSRQVGKTQTVSIRAVHTAVYDPGSLVLLISPSQRQSDEMLRRCRAVYRACGRPVPTVAESATALELENGSRLVSLPGTEGTSRGFAGAKLLVIDEAARVEDDIFAAVLPMVASDGVLACLSTPWGQRGFFHALWADGGSGWERHKVSVYESAQYTPERIAEVRASVGSFVFASDYECSFTDTDSQLFGTESVRAAFTADVKPLFGGM